MGSFGINFALPGIPAMPSLSLGSDARSGINQNGASFAGSGAGDWVVNVAGSGVSAQSATGGIPWLLIAAAAGAVWFITRR